MFLLPFFRGAKKKPYLTTQQFCDFLNKQQRDPRLNEVLYPNYTLAKADELIHRYETKSGMAQKGKNVGRTVLVNTHLVQLICRSCKTSLYILSRFTYLTTYMSVMNSYDGVRARTHTCIHAYTHVYIYVHALTHALTITHTSRVC